MEESEEVDERVLILKDLKTVPDVIYEYSLKDQKTPLVIDNGSFQSRVGFSTSKKPQLIFRNLVAKPRKDRNKKETKEELQNVQPVTLIGNDIVNIEAMRFQLRTQFDRNVVTHFYLQVSSAPSAAINLHANGVTYLHFIIFFRKTSLTTSSLISVLLLKEP